MDLARAALSDDLFRLLRNNLRVESALCRIQFSLDLFQLLGLVTLDAMIR